MVIDLTREEKKTLFQFLSLYLGSLFILFAVIAYLFYLTQYRMHHENIKHQMQMKASELSSQIIHAHMSKEELSLVELSKSDKFKLGFYDKLQKPLATTVKQKIDFSKELNENKNNLLLVNQGAFGHLGVTYIVIAENSFIDSISKIKKEIITFLLILYLFITIVGYYLAKLFIKPIQMKRIALDNFIKESTHELNTPISALLMSIKPQQQMSQKEYSRIKISANRISDIYKDLTYHFLRDNKPQKKLIKNINKALRTQISHLAPLAEKKKLTIVESYDNEIKFEIDEESLIRLLNNLLTNAIKYNKIGGKIEITVKDQTLTIKDSGIGIEKKYQKEIYNRFYRATEQSGGFGLGLNIVYNICKIYNIKIDMESQEGVGTKFKLIFGFN